MTQGTRVQDGDRQETWKDQLQAFFDTRSEEVKGLRPSIERLSYVSGREPRLWMDASLYADLIGSIRDQLALKDDHTLLEVGCAAGFLASGLASAVGRYVGVDIAGNAVAVARSLNISHARFIQADGVILPFADGAFDRVVSYDVFTNIAEWKTAEAMIAEMIRVARPGASVMVGSLADEERREDFERVVQDVAGQLDATYGPPRAIRRPFWRRWSRRRRTDGQIVCYYFRRRDFLELGVRLGVDVRLLDIHKRNPYAGYRFNAVYTKPGR